MPRIPHQDVWRIVTRPSSPWPRKTTTRTRRAIAAAIFTPRKRRFFFAAAPFGTTAQSPKTASVARKYQRSRLIPVAAAEKRSSLTSRTPRKRRASVRTSTWPTRVKPGAALGAPFREGERDRDADDEQEAGEDDVGQREDVLVGGGVTEDERDGRHPGDVVDEDHGQDVEAAKGVEARQPLFRRGRGVAAGPADAVRHASPPS